MIRFHLCLYSPKVCITGFSFLRTLYNSGFSAVETGINSSEELNPSKRSAWLITIEPVSPDTDLWNVSLGITRAPL